MIGMGSTERARRSDSGLLVVYAEDRLSGGARVKVFQALERLGLGDRLTWQAWGRTAVLGVISKKGLVAAAAGFVEVEAKGG